MKRKELFEEFNLAENNPDQGGILYTLRYTPERIEAHREQVVSALDAIGVSFVDKGDLIAVVPKHALSESEAMREYYLLEELSVLNESLEYVEAGLGDVRGVLGLKDTLMSRYFSLMNESDIVDAYNLVDAGIPQMVNDIKAADENNDVLYSGEKEYLKELDDFAKRHSDLLNEPKGVVFFRNMN